MTQDPQDPKTPDGGMPQEPASTPEPPSAPTYGSPQQPPTSPPPPPGGGYGQAPDPSGAYPPPQQGGFTPPPPPGPGPQGQYGQPGPGYGGPPPQQGYGAPGASYGAPSGEPQATESLSRAWEAFKANPWPFVLSQLLWGLILIIPVGILLAVFGVFSYSAPTINPDGTMDPGTAGGFAAIFGIGGIIVALVAIAIAVVQYGAFASATLKAMDGGRVELGDFFKPKNFGQLLLLALILGVAAALLAITVIGSIAVMFFGVWAIFFVVDRNQGAIDALKSSFGFASKNVSQSIVLILLAYVLNIVGSIPCGLGLFVTNPVTLLAFADFYRRVTGPSQAPGFGGPAPQYR